MNKIQLKDIFHLINPCYPRYRVLLYGRNNMSFVTYYELENYSQYFVLSISADNGPILSFVLKKEEV